MKKLLLFALFFFAFYILCSHDMFLKLENYFLEPNTQSLIQLYNGTFEKSENVIERDRMVDVSLIGNGKQTPVDASQWYEKDSITFLNFKTGDAGTWVASVSTTPRHIELKSEDFNRYLKHDGILDMLEKRKANGTLGKDAVEKYSKHVKTIFQVGEQLSNDWNVELGYPIEFVPLENPYGIHKGHVLQIKLLRDGKPLPNHLVYVGCKSEDISNDSHDHEDDHSHSHNTKNNTHEHEDESHHHEHDHNSDHKHTHKAESQNLKHGINEKHEHKAEDYDHNHNSITQLKTNAEGIVDVTINKQGVWYLRTIQMVESKEETLTHESNWATLTFAIGPGLGHSHEPKPKHEHDEHSHSEDEFPTYLFLIISAIIIAILFFWFNRKK